MSIKEQTDVIGSPLPGSEASAKNRTKGVRVITVLDTWSIKIKIFSPKLILFKQKSLTFSDPPLTALEQSEHFY